jgi:hypothetical protein
METISFIISDESVNSLGYRVLTEGIQIDSFLKNPVMLYCHLRPTEQAGQKPILPIGRWENVRKESGKLLGEARFDTDDPFAASVASKVKKGILNSASIGIDLVALSEDSSLMLPGQTLPTITRCELQEVSIADIPSNKNAVRLYHQSKPLVPLQLLSLSSITQTEYERLWKSNKLATLKASDPRRYKILLAEFVEKARSRNPKYS